MTKRTIIKYNSKLKARARKLRMNMTDAEVKLWIHIRKKQVAGIQFFRQRPVGNYIVDFYAPDAGLVIEVDGGQHYEDDGLKNDETRDAFLKEQGLRILRFSNTDVLQNIEGVVGKISEAVG